MQVFDVLPLALILAWCAWTIVLQCLQCARGVSSPTDVSATIILATVVLAIALAAPADGDVGVIGYFYPGSDIDGLDYAELKVAGSVTPVDRLTLGAAAYWSAEFPLNGGDALYVEANAAYAFNDTFSVSGAVGNQSVDVAGYFTGPGTSTDNYTTWNVGAAAAVHGFTLDLRYWDTDEVIANFAGEVVSDERVVLTLRRAL